MRDCFAWPTVASMLIMDPTENPSTTSQPPKCQNIMNVHLFPVIDHSKETYQLQQYYHMITFLCLELSPCPQRPQRGNIDSDRKS